MSLLYLLDGYNIIHQMPMALPDKLEDQRNALIQFVEQNKLKGSRNNALTIVFDGQPGLDNQHSTGSLKIVFSCGESADDKIKTMVHQAQNKKSIIVVTDDRSIQYAVKAEGARVLSVNEFLGKSRPKKVRPDKSSNKPQPKVSQSQAHKITSEFKDIWLKKNK